MNDEHIFALVEAINGAHLYAIHELALDAAFIDDIGQMPSSFGGSVSGFHQGGMFSSVVVRRCCERCSSGFWLSYCFGSGAVLEILAKGKAAS
jgi:hypothetical protein